MASRVDIVHPNTHDAFHLVKQEELVSSATGYPASTEEVVITHCQVIQPVRITYLPDLDEPELQARPTANYDYNYRLVSTLLA